MRSNAGEIPIERSGTSHTSPINDPAMNLTWLGFCQAAKMLPNPREYDSAPRHHQHQYEQGRHICAFIRRVLNLEPDSTDVPTWPASVSFENYMMSTIPPYMVEAVMPEFDELMTYLAKENADHGRQD